MVVSVPQGLWLPPRIATLFVAASDSSDRARAQADYICDGVADDVEINAALTAAAGGRVVPSEGTFNCTGNITIPANTTLEGQGFGTILNFAGAAITNAITIGGDNVCVKNLKAQLAAGAGAPGTRPNVIYATGRTLIWLENLWTVGDTTVADDGSEDRQCGILFDTVTNSKIAKCRVETNRRSGIRLFDASNGNTITGNTSQGNMTNGIYIRDSANNTVGQNTCQGNTTVGINFRDSDNNAVTGNISQGNERGILLYGGSSNTVTGNTCQGNTDRGMYATGGTNNAISSNTFVGGVRALYVEYADGYVIDANLCQGASEHGIYIYRSKNSTVAGNTCADNTQHGIYVSSNAANPNITITGNTCRGNTRHGIYISSLVNSTITGNTCADNDAGGTTYSGIAVDSSSQNTITGNQCDGNGLHGISIFRSSYCTLTGNGCYNQNTGDGINVTGNGTGDADENSLTGNICRGNASDGIEIAGAAFADRNIVVANQLLGNGANPLLNNGTNTEQGHNIVA